MFCFAKCSHSFVDVYLNRKWRVVDPATGNIGTGCYRPLNRKFVIYKKGLNFLEMGIKNYKDLEKNLEFLRNK